MTWRIGEILVQRKLISWEELNQGLEEQRKTGEFIGEVLVRRGRISKHLLYQSLAEQFGLRYVDLKRTKINVQALRLLPQSIAQKYELIPIEFFDGKLIVAVSNPLKNWPEEEISRLTKASVVEKVLCLPDELKAAIQNLYG